MVWLRRSYSREPQLYKDGPNFPYRRDTWRRVRNSVTTNQHRFCPSIQGSCLQGGCAIHHPKILSPRALYLKALQFVPQSHQVFLQSSQQGTECGSRHSKDLLFPPLFLISMFFLWQLRWSDTDLTFHIPLLLFTSAASSFECIFPWKHSLWNAFAVFLPLTSTAFWTTPMLRKFECMEITSTVISENGATPEISQLYYHKHNKEALAYNFLSSL